MRRRPRCRSAVLPEPPQTGEQQGERVLGDGFGVDAFGAGPDAITARPVAGDHVAIRLDARPRELHPLDLLAVGRQQRLELVRLGGFGPHEDVGDRRIDDGAPGLPNGVDQPFSNTGRSERDSSNGHGRGN